MFNSRVQTLGRYAFILHYYQPNHPTFPVEVLINGGRIWQGENDGDLRGKLLAGRSPGRLFMPGEDQKDEGRPTHLFQTGRV